MSFFSKLLDSLRNETYKNLHSAAEVGDLKGVKRLMRRGADVNKRDRVTGNAPLHAAVSGKNADVVRFLIDNGAELKVHRNWYGTPLYMAVAAKDASMVKLLLEKGADPNWSSYHIIEDAYGMVINEGNDATPLLQAVYDSNKEIAELLIAHGADPIKVSAPCFLGVCKNEERVTPLDEAEDEEIKKILEKAKTDCEEKLKENAEETKNTEKTKEKHVHSNAAHEAERAFEAKGEERFLDKAFSIDELEDRKDFIREVLTRMPVLDERKIVEFHMSVKDRMTLEQPQPAEAVTDFIVQHVSSQAQTILKNVPGIVSIDLLMRIYPRAGAPERLNVEIWRRFRSGNSDFCPHIIFRSDEDSFVVAYLQ